VRDVHIDHDGLGRSMKNKNNKHTHTHPRTQSPHAPKTTHARTHAHWLVDRDK
jgi:hypothetical protein